MTPQPAVAAVDKAGGGKELPGAMLQSPVAGGTVAPFSSALGQLQVALLVEEKPGEALAKSGSDEQSKLLMAAPDPAAAALAAVLQWLRQSTAGDSPGPHDKPEVGSAAADATTASAVGIGPATTAPVAAAGALAMSTLSAGHFKGADQERFGVDGARNSAAGATACGAEQTKSASAAPISAAAVKNAPLDPDIHSLADLFRLAAPDTRSTAPTVGSVTSTSDLAIVDGKTALISGIAGNSATGAAAGTDMNSTLRAGGGPAPLPSDRTIGIPVHDYHWSQAIAAQVLVLADHRIESATLRLTPEHLGPVEVRIDMKDSQVNVSFGAAHSDTRAALELALPRLREVLAGAGLTLGEASVHQQMRRDPQNRDAGAHSAPGAAAQPSVAMISVTRMLGVIDEYV